MTGQKLDEDESKKEWEERLEMGVDKPFMELYSKWKQKKRVAAEETCKVESEGSFFEDWRKKQHVCTLMGIVQ